MPHLAPFASSWGMYNATQCADNQRTNFTNTPDSMQKTQATYGASLPTCWLWASPALRSLSRSPLPCLLEDGQIEPYGCVQATGVDAGAHTYLVPAAKGACATGR